MKTLNPTLWRTCRMLAGATRIRLLRAMFEKPGQSVTELAQALGIGTSDASQELRRIQSRGLLKSSRAGLRVIYRLEADPQVPTAAPLLKALKTAFADFSPERDEEMLALAFGLAYPRRIAIARALQTAPRGEMDLCGELKLTPFAVFSHVKILQDGGWIRRVGRNRQFATPDHPLAEALARLLRTS